MNKTIELTFATQKEKTVRHLFELYGKEAPAECGDVSVVSYEHVDDFEETARYLRIRFTDGSHVNIPHKYISAFSVTPDAV